MTPDLCITFLDLQKRTCDLKTKFGQVVIDRHMMKTVTASCDAFKEQVIRLWYALEQRIVLEKSQNQVNHGKIFDLKVQKHDLRYLIIAAGKLGIMDVVGEYKVIIDNGAVADEAAATTKNVAAESNAKVSATAESNVQATPESNAKVSAVAESNVQQVAATAESNAKVSSTESNVQQVVATAESNVQAAAAEPSTSSSNVKETGARVVA